MLKWFAMKNAMICYDSISFIRDLLCSSDLLWFDIRVLGADGFRWGVTCIPSLWDIIKGILATPPPVIRG